MKKCSCKRRHTKRRGHTKKRRGGASFEDYKKRFSNYWNKCNIKQKIMSGQVYNQEVKDSLNSQCCDGYKKYLTPLRPSQCAALANYEPRINEKQKPPYEPENMESLPTDSIDPTDDRGFGPDTSNWFTGRSSLSSNEDRNSWSDENAANNYLWFGGRKRRTRRTRRHRKR